MLIYTNGICYNIRQQTGLVLGKTLETGGNLLAFYSSRLFAQLKPQMPKALHGRSLSRTFRIPGRILNVTPVDSRTEYVSVVDIHSSLLEIRRKKARIADGYFN